MNDLTDGEWEAWYRLTPPGALARVHEALGILPRDGRLP
jgi:hypothetical protein